jgi:hypothetical protein
MITIPNAIYLCLLSIYFFLYYFFVNEIGAYTYTFIVFLLSIYLLENKTDSLIKKITTKSIFKVLGIYIIIFYIVFSKQSDNLIWALLDSLLMTLFLLSFLKLNFKLKKKLKQNK